MIAHSDSVCIEAPTQQVWARLAALEEIKLWSEAVLDARCDGECSQGVGAQRSCDLVGGITIRERWVEWDDGRSFRYEGEGIPVVAHASNRWSVCEWPSLQASFSSIRLLSDSGYAGARVS